jgi:hypothetical protein
MAGTDIRKFMHWEKISTKKASGINGMGDDLCTERERKRLWGERDRAKRVIRGMLD